VRPLVTPGALRATGLRSFFAKCGEARETRIELPEDPEPDGFARVRHVADPDAKQNRPASATLGPPVSQVPSQQWPMVNFDASGR